VTCAKNALEIATIVHRTDPEKKLKQKLAAYEAQALEAKEMNVVQYLSLKTAHDEASSDIKEWFVKVTQDLNENKDLMLKRDPFVCPKAQLRVLVGYLCADNSS
jgi:hypothetical protein